MLSEYAKLSRFWSPLRVALAALVTLGGALATPIYRCLAAGHGPHAVLAAFFAILCFVLIFLALVLPFDFTRRGLPTFRRRSIPALLRLLFACTIGGLGCAVLADERSRTAMLCAWATAGIALFIFQAFYLDAMLERRPRWRIIRAIFDYAFFQLALAVVLFELLCGIWATFSDSYLLVKPDLDVESTIARFRQYTYTCNEHFELVNEGGFFDGEFVQHKVPGEIRVALMADSFGSHFFTPDRLFPNLAEKLLNEQAPADQPWNVMNFSISALGVHEYVYLLEKEARFYQPAAAVICFYAGNDVYDTGIRGESKRSWLAPGRWRCYTVPWKLWRFYREKKQLQKERIEAPPAAMGRLDPQNPDAVFFSRRGYLQLELRNAKQFQHHPAKKERTYAEISRLLRKAGQLADGALLVVIIPTHYQVDPDLFAREFEKHRLVNDVKDLHEPIRRLEAICRESGIECLNLLPELREANRTTPLYLHNDAHWNERGQALAARLLARRLRRWLTPDAGPPPTGSDK